MINWSRRTRRRRTCWIGLGAGGHVAPVLPDQGVSPELEGATFVIPEDPDIQRSRRFLLVCRL